MGDLTGKVAIITGAGRGLGREEAMQLARQGARVVINDINRPDAAAAAHATVDDIKSFGGEALAVLGDCADSGDAENLLKTTLKTYGDLNIMVNNAGFCRDKTIFGMSDDEFDSVVRVHLRGHFVNMRNATAYWRDKNSASSGPCFCMAWHLTSEVSLTRTAAQSGHNKHGWSLMSACSSSLGLSETWQWGQRMRIMARLPECYDCIFVQLLAKGNTVCARHWPKPAAVVLETRIVRTAFNYSDIDRSPLQMVGALLGQIAIQ